MADFTNKAAMGTQRINPSSMVPGARGNAPQGGFRTQLKRSPSGGAEGSGVAPQSQYNQLAQQLAQGLNSQVAQQMMQHTAPQQTGNVPKVPMTNPFANGNSLPLSAAKPMGGNGSVPRVTLPMSPNAGIPMGENDWMNPRVSSAKNGPTPIQHVPTGSWWEDNGSSAQPDGFLGPWATSNEPIRKQQSDLPTSTQQMLGSQTATQQKKNRSYKPEDFAMLSAIFKTLGEQ